MNWETAGTSCRTVLATARPRTRILWVHVQGVGAGEAGRGESSFFGMRGLSDRAGAEGARTGQRLRLREAQRAIAASQQRTRPWASSAQGDCHPGSFSPSSPSRAAVSSLLAMSDAYIAHRIIRRIAGWAVVSFFTEIHVVGGENVPKNGPIIV